MHRITRKSKYKLRRIGKFNYSLTIPPTMVEYLGGYQEDMELSLRCEDGNIIISKDAVNNDIKIEGWEIYLNTFSPFIRNKEATLAFESNYGAYLVLHNTNTYSGNLNECIGLLSSKGIDVPKTVVSALSKYVNEFIIK